MKLRSNSCSGRTQRWNKHLGCVLYGFALLLVVCMTPPRAQAQAGSAYALNNIIDASGVAICDAAVKLTEVNTGMVRDTTSNARGKYVINFQGGLA